MSPAGIVTALAVVLAIFGVSSLPKSPTGGAGSTQTESGTKASKGRPSTESSGPYGPCVRIQKRLIMDWDRMSPTEGARAGIQAYVDAYRTDEPRRYMTAFLNRKK